MYIFRSAGGKLVDASPELQKEMKNELDRVRRVYGGGEGTDMSQFPTFDFPEPKIDPINNSWNVWPILISSNYKTIVLDSWNWISALVLKT